MSDLLDRARGISFSSNPNDYDKVKDELIAEIERLKQIEKSYIALHAISGEQRETIERLKGALRTALADLPRKHKGECENDNLYLEPEQITFGLCDYCIARKALQDKR